MNRPGTNASLPMGKCNRQDGQDWYCCSGDDECDCQTGKNAVKLGGAQPTTVTVVGATSWPGMSSSTTSKSTSTTRTGTTRTRSGSASTTRSTATSGAASSNPTVQPSPSSTAESSSSNTALAAGLGGGLGGAAALAIIGAALWYFRRRRKQSEAKVASSGSSADTPSNEAGAHNLERSAYAEMSAANAIHEAPSDTHSAAGAIQNDLSSYEAQQNKNHSVQSGYNYGVGPVEMEGSPSPSAHSRAEAPHGLAHRLA